jgi:hypothetical protein
MGHPKTQQNMPQLAGINVFGEKLLGMSKTGWQDF